MSPPDSGRRPGFRGGAEICPRDQARRPPKARRSHRAPPPRPHLRPAPRPPPTRSAAALRRRPVRSARRSARLGPGPGPGPRAPHASPPAGAAPQMRLREEEPRGPGSPRAAGRGRGAGRCARGRGPHGCAQNQARIRPPAWGCGVGGELGGTVLFPAPHPHPRPRSPQGGAGSPWLSNLVPEPEERLEICGRWSREGRLLEQGHTALTAVAREFGTPG